MSPWRRKDHVVFHICPFAFYIIHVAFHLFLKQKMIVASAIVEQQQRQRQR